MALGTVHTLLKPWVGRKYKEVINIKCYLCLFTSLKSVYKLSSLQHNTKCGQLKKCHDLCKAYWVSNSVFDYTKSIAPLSYLFPLNFMILWQCPTETKSSTNRKTGSYPTREVTRGYRLTPATPRCSQC